MPFLISFNHFIHLVFRQGIPLDFIRCIRALFLRVFTKPACNRSGHFYIRDLISVFLDLRNIIEHLIGKCSFDHVISPEMIILEFRLLFRYNFTIFTLFSIIRRTEEARGNPVIRTFGMYAIALPGCLPGELLQSDLIPQCAQLCFPDVCRDEDRGLQQSGKSSHESQAFLL